MTILLIDDDEDDRMLFRDVINEAFPSFKFKEAASAEQGLAMLNGNVLPDYIFLDINMPTTDGITCLRRIRSNPITATANVVMYSTSFSVANIREFKTLNAQFVQKQFTVEKMVNCLAYIFGEVLH